MVGKINELESFYLESFKLERFFSWKEPFEVGKNKVSWKDFGVVGQIICSCRPFAFHFQLINLEGFFPT